MFLLFMLLEILAVGGYEICRNTVYLTHFCPDNFKCCGDDGIHCCMIDYTWTYISMGVGGFMGVVLLSIFLYYFFGKRCLADRKVAISSSDNISVKQVKNWDREGELGALRTGYLHAVEQETIAWQQENANAEEGLQKQQIDLELAENRAKIASEILEKAQRNQEDAIHIDQALQRKIVCDNRVLKARILWDLAVELTKRDALTLAPIIEKAQRKKINDEERILKWSREILFFLEHQDKLDRALRGGSYEELCNVLTKVKDLGFEKKCARLVFRAKLKIGRVEKFQSLLKCVLEMNHMQMQDLIDFTEPDEVDKNISSAPDSLVKVLQAVAILLGGEEECWMELQAMVTRMGEGSLKRRAMSCEIEMIPPVIISEVSKLLNDIDELTIQEECRTALPIYKWCHAIVMERLMMTEEDCLINREIAASLPVEPAEKKKKRRVHPSPPSHTV